MNTKLKNLFEKYKFSTKDKYEIEQFYLLLSDIKKQNFLNNFDLFALRIQEIDDNIRTEKKLLLWNAISRIKNAILENRAKNWNENTKKEINFLKGELKKD